MHQVYHWTQTTRSFRRLSSVGLEWIRKPTSRAPTQDSSAYLNRLNSSSAVRLTHLRPSLCRWTSPTVGISAPPSFYLGYGCTDSQYGSPAPLCGAGSCNTYSVFWNGGTGKDKNGVPSDVNAAAILSSQFLAPNISTPSSGPTLAPQPTTPPILPAPSPSKPLVCAYNRSYAIKAVGCTTSNGGGLYIASPSGSDCRNNLVTLRSARQVNPKLERIRWTIDTDGHVVSDERAGSCPSSSNLVGRDADVLKVGGSGWRWRIEPVSDASCDRVRFVSLNRRGVATILSADSDCNGFVYGADLDGSKYWSLT